jgi:hypothetical protein
MQILLAFGEYIARLDHAKSRKEAFPCMREDRKEELARPILRTYKQICCLKSIVLSLTGIICIPKN